MRSEPDLLSRSEVATTAGATVLATASKQDKLDRLVPLGLDRHDAWRSHALERPAVRGDAHALPFASRCFDGAVVMHALAHFTDPLAALADRYRVEQEALDGYLSDPFALGTSPDGAFDFSDVRVAGVLTIQHQYSIAALRLEVPSWGLSADPKQG